MLLGFVETPVSVFFEPSADVSCIRGCSEEFAEWLCGRPTGVGSIDDVSCVVTFEGLSPTSESVFSVVEFGFNDEFLSASDDESWPNTWLWE